MSFSPLVAELIHALRALPGVGPKSAQRMAIHILEHQREEGLRLADALKNAVSHVGRCSKCRTLCETPLCKLCSNPNRDQSQLCVLESPMDILAVEHNAAFRGLYFVLMGRLSPLDGIGPRELKLEELEARLQDPALKEVILATNPTVEGEATAQYVADMAKRFGRQVTRIA
ncbi:MAG: recombination protein RecR, partial [Gammaproteobacteria bacterium]|nr:recombination protein RecR [Gammaproteobacteria bacterium]